ncbi:MAG TPA: MBL fold metallo-hydrolase [Phycisphaerales bacterium]|nr:MBL fold metallo-hydrolase [Phycisphaerales bacterium]
MTDPNRCTIETFSLGPYQTNCYIVRGIPRDGEQEKCWVADVGFEPEPMLDRLETLGLIPEAFILTHAHLDHIAGLFEARRRFPGIPIWIHEAEKDWLTDDRQNLSAFSPTPVTAPPADRLLRENDNLHLAGQTWRVLHTPGHSPGGISLYCDAAGVCLCGDAIFNGSIGRTDFPGSDFDTLAASIRSKLYALPDDTVLYPGHGPTTTVGAEKRSNPFVRTDP